MSQPPTDGTNRWDAEAYDDGLSFVYEYGTDVLDLLAPEPGERVLDVGCGTGHLTRAIADAGAEAVGVDASEAMVEAARREHPGLRFVHADARDLAAADDAALAGAFDAVFSNAALHWITEQDRAIASAADVIRPGGRFVAELGGADNVAAIVDATLAALADRGYDGENPWYFPTVGTQATTLERHGFEVRYATLFDRPTELDGGADGLANWLHAFGDGLLAPAPADERDAIVADVEDALRAERFRDGTWVADYRRLRFVAVYTG